MSFQDLGNRGMHHRHEQNDGEEVDGKLSFPRMAGCRIPSASGCEKDALDRLDSHQAMPHRTGSDLPCDHHESSSSKGTTSFELPGAICGAPAWEGTVRCLGG